MSKHLERDLDTLEREILTQSALVEEMIRLACRGLCDRRKGVHSDLMRHEPQINRREVVIEEECLKILALHQPVAVDLRRVATVLKVNSDLERIADLTVNIGERADSLAEHLELAIPERVERMAHTAIEMVRDALDALVDLDVAVARRVCQQDDDVDLLNRQVIDEVCRTVRLNPAQIEPALHLFSASRHIERIADHATNIAEDVVYLVEGAITRHRHEDMRTPQQ